MNTFAYLHNEYLNMKKLVQLFLFLGIIGSVAVAQDNKTTVKWYTFEEAVALNQQNPKKILIDVYTDWCGWCKTMDKNTFSNPSIAKYLNENFYPVKFNAESTKPVSFKGQEFKNRNQGNRSPHDLAIALLSGKMSYPSIAYLDGENNLITAVAGYSTPSQIEPILVYIVEEHYTKTPWDTFIKSFKGKIKE